VQGVIHAPAIPASRRAWPSAAAASGEEKPPLLAEIGFCGLLLLLLVTLHPFQPPAVGTTVGVSGIESVASDIWRQLSFTSIFAFAFGATIYYRPAALLRAVPLTMMVLLGWCLLSATWSAAGGVVFRRAVLITEVTITPLLGVALLGPERAFSRLRTVLVIVLVANWISIPLISTAVHGAGEQDPKLIGNWRGLYDQKNVAGAVCTLTVLQFLFPGLRTRRWTDWLVIVAALVFLYFSKSKTSLALLPVAAAFGYAYRAGWKNGLDRALLALTAVLAIGCIATLLALNTALIDKIMADPDAFTGRTEIWNAEIAYLKDHFLLGAGFGSIFSTGLQSPLSPYLHGRNWVAMVSNSHNGYFDMITSLGAIGFALALMALLVAPFRRFWALNFDRAKAGYFAIFIFVIFHNFTEADFLSSDGVSWLVFLMVIGALRQPASAPAPVQQAARPPAATLAWQARAQTRA
jgi:exopolysaccharide production protein ExoQ